jgi:hypothetical protein
MEKSMGGLLKPGVRLLATLSARNKFWVVALPLLLTVVLLTLLHLSGLTRHAPPDVSSAALASYQERTDLEFWITLLVAVLGLVS